MIRSLRRTGESAAWRQKMESGSIAESYADIAVTPNFDDSGYVMIFRGLTTQATEAAGELATRPEFAKVLSSLAMSKRESCRYFEILLRTRMVAGVARDPEVVATRVLHPRGSGT